MALIWSSCVYLLLSTSRH